MTERIRSQEQASEMEVLRRVHGVILRDKVCIYEIRKGLFYVVTLVLRIERSQFLAFRCFINLLCVKVLTVSSLASISTPMFVWRESATTFVLSNTFFMTRGWLEEFFQLLRGFSRLLKIKEIKSNVSQTSVRSQCLILCWERISFHRQCLTNHFFIKCISKQWSHQ